jgi:DNA-binding transcriptional ArsR family regulator
VAGVAALIGDPARAAVLTALLDGRALSASELAALALVTKSTMSAHLEKLARAGLVGAERQGRHKYFRLAHADVAHALESLLGLAELTAERTAGPRLRAGPADPALRKARVCYDHLAGEVGVLVYDGLLRGGALVATPTRGSRPPALALAGQGVRLFEAVGIDPGALQGGRRPLCRACLDWSERRHHLAGALGAALLRRITELRWARRVREGRALVFSPAGEAALRRVFAPQGGARAR